MRSWVVKWGIGLALVGLIVFEIASPSLAKVQVDGAASKAAFEARLEYERGPNVDNAKAKAVEEAAKAHAVVEKFDIGPDGGVTVTLYRRAKSFVAYRWKKLYNHYDVRVSAESKRGSAS